MNRSIIIIILTLLFGGQALFAKQIKLETFSKTYRGTIGKYQVKMELINRFSSLAGNYSYQSQHYKSIDLTGAKKGRNIDLNDGDDRGANGGMTERFTGSFINDSTIAGTWTKDKITLSFKLTEVKKRINAPANPKFGDLIRFAGLDPWESHFFEKPLVERSLKNMLKNDYNSYLNLLKDCAYGNFTREKNGLVTNSFFIEHVGDEDQSTLVIDPKTRSFYLCWLKENCDETYIYSGQPNGKVPDAIIKYFLDGLNSSFGHSHKFSKRKNGITCDLFPKDIKRDM